VSKKCSCGQNMRERSKDFVKSCHFVQTVPTTPQYYSNHHGSQPVGAPQSVGIKGQFIPATPQSFGVNSEPIPATPQCT